MPRAKKPEKVKLNRYYVVNYSKLWKPRLYWNSYKTEVEARNQMKRNKPWLPKEVEVISGRKARESGIIFLTEDFNLKGTRVRLKHYRYKYRKSMTSLEEKAYRERIRYHKRKNNENSAPKS